jgi:hypothetical protein
MIRQMVDNWTLLVLAIGILAAVILNVAKSIVRDYNDLRGELRRTRTTTGAK